MQRAQRPTSVHASGTLCGADARRSNADRAALARPGPPPAARIGRLEKAAAGSRPGRWPDDGRAPGNVRLPGGSSENCRNPGAAARMPGGALND